MERRPSSRSVRCCGGVSWLQIQKCFVLIGCILISMTIGRVFSFGNMLPYMSSYLAFSNQSHSDSLVSAYRDYQYHTATVYCLLVVFQSISMSIGCRAYSVFGFRRSCLIGCFISSFGIGLTYFTCNNLFLCSLTYGIMPGIGVGIVLSAYYTLSHSVHFHRTISTNPCRL